MSPEQSTGDGPVDARSDLYALACVLYELLTGEPPHTGPTAHAIMAKRLTVTPTAVRTLRATVSESVEQAIKKALEVVPADRHSSVEAFSRALSDGKTPEPFPQLEAFAPVAAVAPTATPFVGRASGLPRARTRRGGSSLPRARLPVVRAIRGPLLMRRAAP